MYYRATILAAAGAWAMALSAQTPPPMRLPDAPKFTLAPQARAAHPEVQAALRKYLQSYSLEATTVCAIPLLRAPVPDNLEQMPVLRPGADSIDRMPFVNLPAPPCDEEKR
jgi:hypothetical protein